MEKSPVENGLQMCGAVSAADGVRCALLWKTFGSIAEEFELRAAHACSR